MTRFLIRLISRMSLACVCITLLALGLGQAINLGDNEIVFSGIFDKHGTEIYWMDIAHQLFYCLTDDNVVKDSPIWSPDGQQIAYVINYANEKASGTSIIVRNIKNNTVRQLINNSTVESGPSWSPDGRYIAFAKGASFSSSPELMVIDLQFDSVRQLTNTPRISDNSPTWSPDSRFIAFRSSGNSPQTHAIVIIDLQTEKIRPLITSQDFMFGPEWSPDGRYIAYISRGINSGIYLWDTIQAYSIFLHDTLTNGTLTVNWSSDSRSIIYSDLVDDKHGIIFRLEITPCIEKTSYCSPQLLGPSVGAYYSPRWRPHQP